jgi:hypothetical protein
MFPQIAVDREWSCGVAKSTQSPSDLAAQGFFSDSLLSSVAVDTAILDGVVNDPDVNLCIILTQRVADAAAPSGVRLYNKYLCAGEYSATIAYETWSRYSAI